MSNQTVGAFIIGGDDTERDYDYIVTFDSGVFRLYKNGGEQESVIGITGDSFPLKRFGAMNHFAELLAAQFPEQEIKTFEV